MNFRLLVFFCLLLFNLQCQIKTGIEHPSNAAFVTLGLEEITIEELQQGYLSGEFSVLEVVQAYLGRIEAIDLDPNGPELNSVITINSEAIDIAASMDTQLLQSAEGVLPLLFGIPVLLKDNIDTKEGMPNKAGARAMAESRPYRDAFIVQQLREAGAIILGKTNLSEWANFHSSFSSSGWSGLGGQTKNPYDQSVYLRHRNQRINNMSSQRQRFGWNQTYGWVTESKWNYTYIVYSRYSWTYDKNCQRCCHCIICHDRYRFNG